MVKVETAKAKVRFVMGEGIGDEKGRTPIVANPVVTRIATH